MPNKSNLAKLNALIKQYAVTDCIAAFSGGADSTLVLKVLQDACRVKGTKAIAIFVKSKVNPKYEEAEARKTAEGIGADFVCLEYDLPEDMKHNPIDRCYLCKRAIFTSIRNYADEHGISTILDGTNSDDTKVYRPGLKALAECGVVSPLAKVNFDKKTVRNLLRFLELPAADKPATPCLATRFAYGMELESETLLKVSEAEARLKELGFYNVRLRVHPGSIGRIEVDSKDLLKAAQMADVISTIVQQAGINYPVLDLIGFRSGSMDELIKSKQV